MTRAKPTKRSALRNAEYYDFQDVLDKLYADSDNGCQFQQLTALICNPQNIILDYSNIKKKDDCSFTAMGKPTAYSLCSEKTKQLSPTASTPCRNSKRQRQDQTTWYPNDYGSADTAMYLANS